ncbi:hypothetical protein BOTBODRAFT_35560 [Botryobasidium botryosum FD-172 SS1]|uniref:Uncharacterized protein n=1 Tax=Botryobasidium botryosum (strain FD-172 SS1) TaxID=930990 RepID=A0A067M6S4_BOTB1|nr:hypothetical protein BOTBODRAFT_35560 [Botryobasidium botryosum FD-172 SS1]
MAYPSPANGFALLAPRPAQSHDLYTDVQYLLRSPTSSSHSSQSSYSSLAETSPSGEEKMGVMKRFMGRKSRDSQESVV